jgi:uncharacterized protein
MAVLTEKISAAWADRKGPVILSTVDKDGIPNAIFATCVSKFDEETLVVADNFFDKTQKNILSGSKGSILFITNNDKAFQVKGTIEYLKAGDIFEDMKTWNGERPGHAAAALKVEEVYTGAEKLVPFNP